MLAAVLELMEIDSTTGGMTVAVVLPLMLPLVAVMVTGLEVTATPVATPLPTPPGGMVILVGSEDVHATELEMSSVLWSLKVPVAVYFCGVWKTSTAFAGVTAIDTSVADVTVSVAGGLVIEPDVAVIEVVPAAMLLARPCVPGELLMVATEVLDEVQVAAMAGKWVPSA